MPAAFDSVFAALKRVLVKHAKRFAVKADTAAEYTLVSKSASPFPQHKGQPLFFASVRAGKAYVSFHFMPLYMCPELTRAVSPALKKRMQGKSCFHFKTEPDAETMAGLKEMTEAGIRGWKERKWI